MFGDVPPLRFVKTHPGTLVYLPRHLTHGGTLPEQQYQIVCACGWKSHPSHSQTVIGGEQQDHVFQEWLKTKTQE